jgi:hypothetical protein
MEIKYNVPIEVNKKQYDVCMSRYDGICAGRKDENGKYFIKVLFIKYAKQVAKDLKNYA